MGNKFIVAAAGSWKTTHIVEKALEIEHENVLITTYTEANEDEIRKKIIAKKWYIPPNIQVRTWFSFLLCHGVRPYQDAEKPGMWDVCIWFCLPEGRSGILKTKNGKMFTVGKDKDGYYFTSKSDPKIFSDKISEYIIRCNEKTKGEVVSRLSRIFPNIFIDEIQDMAWYDLEFIALLLKSKSDVCLVGDPRQGTYSTNNSAKNKKYQKSNILEFFERKEISSLIEFDTSSFVSNHRCNQEICDLSDKLFPDYPKTTSSQQSETWHDGVFFIQESWITEYLTTYPECVQLRYDVRDSRVCPGYKVMNFWTSKWLTFDRVLIYPTWPILKWLDNEAVELAESSRSKFYVALTRARYSVAIVK